MAQNVSSSQPKIGVRVSNKRLISNRLSEEKKPKIAFISYAM